MKNILAAKHWQLFLTLCVAPGVLVIIIVMTFDMRMSMPPGGWLETISVCAFALWLYLTGRSLHQRLPEDIRVPLWSLPVSLFPAVLFMIYVGITVTEGYLITAGTRTFRHKGASNPTLSWIWFFGGIAGLVYALYFVARSVNTVTAGKKVPLYRWIGDFFLLLFFPAGVWFIAPRLNTIAAPEKEAEMDIFK